jgi:type I restriction enzyme, S subunit
MLLSNLNLLAQAPGGVARLRELILTLAVQGKLVPQDAKDEPASALLKKIRAEKDRLIAEGKIKRDKPLAEIAEEEKPFGLPVNWEWVPLQRIGYTQTGTTPDKKNPQMYGDGIPFIKPGDIYPNHVDYDNEALSQEGLNDSGRIAPAGSLLMVCIGTIGKSNLIARDCSFNQQINSVTPLCCLPEYVKLYCRCPYFQGEVWARSSSTTIAILNKGKWEAIPFALPPLAEQSRIVTRVEELMRLCDALEAKGQLEASQHAQLVSTLLATLSESETPAQLADNWHRIATHFDLLLDRPETVDALEQTILQLAVRGLLVPQDPQDEPAYMYLQRLCEESGRDKSKDAKHVNFQAEAEGLPAGWCLASVASVADCLDFMRKPIKKDERQVQGASVPYYGANGQVGWIEDFLFDEDLVLVVEDETFIGRTKPFSYIVRGKSWVNNHAHVLRPLAGMTADYLNLCLQRYDFIPLTSGTTNRRKLTKAGLLDAQFMVAPLAEQARIVTRVAQLRRLCADLRQRLAASQSTQAHLAEALVQEVA